MAQQRTTSAFITHPREALRRPVAAMMKALDHARAISAWRRIEVFGDWLEIAEVSLKQLPAHLAHQRTHGRMLLPEEEPAEVQALWKRMRERYGAEWPTVARCFHEALDILRDAAARDWNDWLGQFFMEWELGSQWHGQYFSPWSIALMMAQVHDPAPLVYERVKEALLHEDNHVGQALLLGAALIEDATEAERYFVETLVPAALPYIDPVTVYEPCVGSGVMLLAMASQVPTWANQYGIVRYYGQDADALCVQMARINLMICGLNGFAMQCMVAAYGDGQPPAATVDATAVTIPDTTDHTTDVEEVFA